MRGTRKTVNASVTTSAVCVDGELERHARCTGNFVDDGLGTYVQKFDVSKRTHTLASFEGATGIRIKQARLVVALNCLPTETHWQTLSNIRSIDKRLVGIDLQDVVAGSGDID